MINRISILTKMQLPDRVSLFNKRKTKKMGIYIGIRLLALALITTVIAAIYFFFNEIMGLRVDYNLLIFFLGLTQIIGVIGNIGLLINDLYLSKDNMILFAYPVMHNEVFISKLIVFYISEFIKNIYLIIPALVAYGIFSGFNIGYVINIFVVAIIVPLICVFLSALLSLPVMFVKNFLQNHPIVCLISFIVFFTGFVYLVVKITAVIPHPFRLLAMYKTYIGYLNDFIVKFNAYMIIIYNCVNILFNFRTIYDYLIIFGVAIILIIAVYLLAMPLYFKIVSGAVNTNTKKIHQSNQIKCRDAFSTFLNKEIKIITRDSFKLVGYVASILSYPLWIYVINSILGKFNTNELGLRLIIGFNIIIGMTLLSGMNSSAASAITEEGAEFMVLKTAPSKTYKITWAKITVSIFASTVSILLSIGILLGFTNLHVIDILLLTLVLLLLNASHVMWSFQYDLLHPYLNEYSITRNLNCNKNTGVSVFTGILMAVGFAVFAMFFLMESYVGGWIRVITATIVFFAIRLALLIVNMKVYFNRIEM